jgi:IS4 transposase
VICDQRVVLNGYTLVRKYPDPLRRIRYKDTDSGKTLVFLTNNMALPALTICALYKSRWQVELFLWRA